MHDAGAGTDVSHKRMTSSSHSGQVAASQQHGSDALSLGLVQVPILHSLIRQSTALQDTSEPSSKGSELRQSLVRRFTSESSRGQPDSRLLLRI